MPRLKKVTACNQCQIVMINGVRCHELGCPIAWRDYWRKCKTCGDDFRPKNPRQYHCRDCRRF